MGFINYYLKRTGEQFIENLIRSSHHIDNEQDALVAWGAIWKHLDQQIDDRKEAIRFVSRCSWLKREMLEPHDYWHRLIKSKFLITPAGNGIQAPKLAEAWLTKTIPIVTRNPCFEDLLGAGFPLFMINNWSDLTQNKLDTFEEKRLNIDWNKILQMLTVDFFLLQIFSK